MTKEQAEIKRKNSEHLIGTTRVKIGVGFKMKIDSIGVRPRQEGASKFHVYCNVSGDKSSYSDDLDNFLDNYLPIG